MAEEQRPWIEDQCSADLRRGLPPLSKRNTLSSLPPPVILG